MAEINGNIPAGVQVPQFDPLAAVSKAQALGTGILQNRLLGQQVQSKIALGNAVTQATDAATGKTDWNKALGLLSQDPQGAFAVPELAGQVQEREARQLQISKDQLGLAKDRWTMIGDTAGSLLTDKTPLTREGVIKILADNLVGSGKFNDENSVGMLTSFVQNLPTDDAGIRKALGQVYTASGDTLQRIQALQGTPSTLDTGSQIIEQQVSPLTGGIQVNGVVAKTRSPSEKAALVQVWDPARGAYVSKPSGEIIGDAAPGAQPGRGVAVQTAPALGEPEAAQRGVEQAQAWRQAAETAPEQKAQIQNLRDQVGKFTSGPQASWIYRAKALATMLGVAPKDVKDEVAAQEEFAKLAQQWANANTGQLGEGTDSKLNAALKASPNEFLSTQGVTGILALLEGQQDAAVAKNAAWQKWLNSGKSPGTAGQFQTQWNEIYNPRVFQSQYMSDAQRQNMLRSMSPKERDRFQKDWITAKKAGWIE